jgi:hypothetical protein
VKGEMIMRIVLVFVFALFVILPGYGQFKQEKKSRHSFLFAALPDESLKQKPRSVLQQLFPMDNQRYYRLSNPVLMQKGNSDFVSSNAYWTAFITTQSFNNGKIGTFYYWDIQGNLRESRLFFEISGKNNRSFKLVFPRR